MAKTTKDLGALLTRVRALIAESRDIYAEIMDKVLKDKASISIEDEQNAFREIKYNISLMLEVQFTIAEMREVFRHYWWSAKGATKKEEIAAILASHLAGRAETQYRDECKAKETKQRELDTTITVVCSGYGKWRIEHKHKGQKPGEATSTTIDKKLAMTLLEAATAVLKAELE